MQILNKGSWVYEMAVMTSKENSNKIESIILKANSVIMGRRSKKDVVNWLITLDLVAMDDLIQAMLDAHLGEFRFRKAKKNNIQIIIRVLEKSETLFLFFFA